MTTIPDAPGAEYAFQAPPSWPAPPGFDPRRGHVVDPTWPDAPPDWQFWTKPAVPIAARAGVSRGTWVRIAIGVVIVIVVISRFVSGGSDAGTHTGSCWKLDSGTTYTPVDCGDPAAQYKVTSEVSDPADCPSTSDSYLDSKNEGAADRYRCLVPVTH